MIGGQRGRTGQRKCAQSRPGRSERASDNPASTHAFPARRPQTTQRLFARDEAGALNLLAQPHPHLSSSSLPRRLTSYRRRSVPDGNNLATAREASRPRVSTHRIRTATAGRDSPRQVLRDVNLAMDTRFTLPVPGGGVSTTTGCCPGHRRRGRRPHPPRRLRNSDARLGHCSA